MPKSRGRKDKKRAGSRTVREKQRRVARSSTVRQMADIRILRATDEAEARGDARGALDLMKQDLRLRDDDSFWRPEKIERLMQLSVLGPVLPDWATSRWILAQAAQWLDEANRSRTSEAFTVAFRVGGFVANRYRDDVDLRTKILDHNWVFRQAFLYDLGGLRHFLDQVASADLVAGADHIAEWAETPLSGFQLMGETPRTLHWLDLREGTQIATPNIGSATLLEPGDCAVGRLQPVDDGWMFDSAPLYVPRRAAQQVAEEPADWVKALARVGQQAGVDGSGFTTVGHDFQLLTDVPRIIQHLLLIDVEENVFDRPVVDRFPERLPLEVGLVRAAMDGLLDEDIRGLRPWPTVGAALLQPPVFAELLSPSRPEDPARLRQLAPRLAEPAATVCLDLAFELEAAA
jgi:hypothetical protein